MIGALFSGLRGWVDSSAAVVFVYPALALVGILTLIFGVLTEIGNDA